MTSKDYLSQNLARNYGAVASKYYGYQVSVIDLRNPTRSDGNNLLTLINRYMDLAREHPDSLTYKARAEKYTKILAKSIVNPGGDSSQRGENVYFYESAEGLLAAVILLLSEYLPPAEGEPETRHIVSVFKLVQALLAVDPRSKDQRNGFQILMDRLPENHRAYMLAGAALTASDQAMASGGGRHQELHGGPHHPEPGERAVLPGGQKRGEAEEPCGVLLRRAGHHAAL